MKITFGKKFINGIGSAGISIHFRKTQIGIGVVKQSVKPVFYWKNIYTNIKTNCLVIVRQVNLIRIKNIAIGFVWAIPCK